jgi:mxaJ protein
MKVEYTWFAQRRGFVRNTLNAGTCDVIIGVPSSFELTATTRPYYRSSYVFVTRADRKLDIRSFDDARLRTLRIGVQLIGDDGANSPPAHALSNRGIITNVAGYPVYGDYSTNAPSRTIVDAVSRGDVDVAIVWGPIAGYFVKKSRVRLSATPVSPAIDLPYLPFVFDMSMGVRRTDETLKARLDEALSARQSEIASILRDYGIPRVDRVRTAR